MLGAAGRLIAPIEALIGTNVFADLVSALIRGEAAYRRQVARVSNPVLHAWNLPTGEDLRRMEARLAALDAQVRDLADDRP